MMHGISIRDALKETYIDWSDSALVAQYRRYRRRSLYTLVLVGAVCKAKH